jgi:general stress protein 26
MNKIIGLIIWIFFLSACNRVVSLQYRESFTPSEQKVMQAAREVLSRTEYLSLITLDGNCQPRARIMEFLPPDSHFEIWMATNPKSRKVQQLNNDSRVTLHYFDKSTLAYVSLMGNAYLINSDSLKKIKWKEGWERFYPDRKKDLILIQFIPHTLEFIGIVRGYTGDSVTWAPHKVVLMK